MINGLIKWVLSTYLGKYLKDFNPSQLSIAMLSGEVELENVPINKDSLRSFGIPVQASSGCIGKIKLHIPFRQFRTSPWSITIEKVYCVFGPKDINDWDTEREIEDDYEYKVRVLESREAKWRVQSGCNVETYYSMSYSTWMNFGATVATNILENLELKINDVHLRYEDTLTIPYSSFAAGIRIKSLTISTCGPNWTNGTKVTFGDLISYKLLELNDFRLYWDRLEHGKTCRELYFTDLLDKMNIFSNENEHSYFIYPINATAKFKRERCKEPIKTKDRPRISCDVFIPQINLYFSEIQYNQIIECYSNLQNIQRLRTFRILRPIYKVRHKAKLWWKYALECNGFSIRNSVEKWQTIKDNIRYVKICLRLLENPNENLTSDDNKFKIEMEKCRSLPVLQMLREATYVSFSGKNIFRNRNISQGKGILYHWFPNWWGRYCKGNTENGNYNSIDDETYQNIEDDILNALKESIENESFSKRDAVFGYFTFSLSDGHVSLTTIGRDNKQYSAIVLEFQKLFSFVEVKPRFRSYCLGITLACVSISDKLTQSLEFPYLIQPQTQKKHFGGMFINKDLNEINGTRDDPWFQLQFGKTPCEYCGYRLIIKSKSLDIVYNEKAWRWIFGFFGNPLYETKVRENVREIDFSPRFRFLRKWKNLFISQRGIKKKCFLEIDIFAPRIICAENFIVKNTSVILIDFGRFRILKNDTLYNNNTQDFTHIDHLITDLSDDDEMFMTPCSTPFCTDVIRSESPSYVNDMPVSSKFIINRNTGLENMFDNNLYDQYNIYLTDLQVLIYNCANYNNLKTSSNIHLIEKFNISLQLERRNNINSNVDEPSLTLSGSLPTILIYMNDQKIVECMKILYTIKLDILPTVKPKSNMITCVDAGDKIFDFETGNTIVQFIIGQIILEVQSQKKSLVELQVIGVKASIFQKNVELHMDMSVHGLLLVDAIQSFGRDFELLLASHRYVEIDSISGSIKQSESFSPQSPDTFKYQGPDSSCLYNNKAINLYSKNNDALITIDINLMYASREIRSRQIACITFNNLDVIANQETVVELFEFVKRILENSKVFQKQNKDLISNNQSRDKLTTFSHGVEHYRTDISFVFHRLNILVLRNVSYDDVCIGRKVGTLTMNAAKIHATLDGETKLISGELGGIQIIDITSEGQEHQRILSVGKIPLSDSHTNFIHKSHNSVSNNNPMYKYIDAYGNSTLDTIAFNFQINRLEYSNIDIIIRMASVWYTHCPRFIEEIYLCVKEFKQYFMNFMQSIRDKASVMAKGLVKQMSLMQSMRGSSIDISFDIILNSPVLVLPKSCNSSDVLVANLGKITISNSRCNNIQHANIEIDKDLEIKDTYYIDIKNINLFSLNISKRRAMRLNASSKASEIYSCDKDAIAILHDTALVFQCVCESKPEMNFTERNVLIEGNVTQNLHVTLTQYQYIQLCDTIKYATNFILDNDNIFCTVKQLGRSLNNDNKDQKSNIYQKVSAQFSVPVLKLDLRNEHNVPLIHITFQEFDIQSVDDGVQHEMQIRLRSVLMEDVKCLPNTKYRNMVDSTNDVLSLNKSYTINRNSSSCPNMSTMKINEDVYTSIPLNLNMKAGVIQSYENIMTLTPSQYNKKSHSSKETNNLVIYKSIVTTHSQQCIPVNTHSIDFNCLNLVVSREKWFMIFEFFGISRHQHTKEGFKQQISEYDKNVRIMKITISSLNLILVRNDDELAKANISKAVVSIKDEMQHQTIDGNLGSISIYDLSAYGKLYGEKFSTSREQAITFTYKMLKSVSSRSFASSISSSLDTNAYLSINMSSIKYVHTKRFLMEMHLFFKELLQLRSRVLCCKGGKEMSRSKNYAMLRIGLDIHVESPIVLLPISYRSNHLLIANFGKFSLTNSFEYINNVSYFMDKINIEQSLSNIIVDIMSIHLKNINLFTGERANYLDILNTQFNSDVISVGRCFIVQLGRSIFKENCYLKLNAIRCSEIHDSLILPDISINGNLSELNGLIDLKQYKLIRGFFNYNLGEIIDDVYYNYNINITEFNEYLSSMNEVELNERRSTLSINFLLENVTIYLSELIESSNLNTSATLGCIKFIKSKLDIDFSSDGSLDIDLISSEILILDAKDYNLNNSTRNIFTYILKPSIERITESTVQAEIHSRRRNGLSKYTILLNNMRIMIILNFLEHLKNFLQNEPYTNTENEMCWNNAAVKKPQHIYSRYNQLMNTKVIKSEFVINITNSEMVFVEKTDIADTNAIILKSTTVFSYKPNNQIIPISVDINHLEIFSCILNSENDTSLSIIDPFTLNIELRNNCFQIVIQNQLFVRLSYNDIMLFTRMMHPIPKQTASHVQTSQKCNDFEKVDSLISRDFKQSDCCYVMQKSNFNLNEIVEEISQKQKHRHTPSNKLNNVTLNVNSISLCIIDDCLDADVPLLELSLSRLVVKQKVQMDKDTWNLSYIETEFETIIMSDYYNRRLSGWEPLIESWECCGNCCYIASKSNRLSLNISSKQVLKLNVTSACMELCDLVRKNWLSDYYGQTKVDINLTSIVSTQYRIRHPFIPFALKNITGEPLIFKIFYTQPGLTRPCKNDLMCNWISVQHNETVPFDFGPQSKLRHLDSHKLNMHQILVQIHGWTLLGPISIDKVGIFFRYATLDLQYKKKNRIVFNILLRGSAQKLITISSALNIINTTNKRFFLRMHSHISNESAITFIEPSEKITVPLRYIDSLIYLKPYVETSFNKELCEIIAKDKTGYVKKKGLTKNCNPDDFNFSIKPALWSDCINDSVHEIFCCNSPKEETFYTLVEIRKDSFPTREKNFTPGHTIRIVPPLKLKNLLCCDLFYEICNHTNGNINASEEVELYTVDLSDTIYLKIFLDNYKLSGQLKIPTGHSGIVEPKLKLVDDVNRELCLRVSIQALHGQGMEVYISAPIWIHNKTGLPLIFKQEGSSNIAAGQFEEHEYARQFSPLMFSFSDQESSPLMGVRLGKIYGENNPWCKSFSIHKETTFRQLRMEKMKLIYMIGINVQRGKGIYCYSTFVTFSPRFQLYNRSSYKLEFAQKCDVINFKDTGLHKIIKALPGSNFPFHWPNCDEDRLLCVRIGNEGYYWSHGLPVNETRSLYINIRNDIGEMTFLRLEIILHCGTYLLHFSNARTLPPPLRIDNYSEVMIYFCQKCLDPYWRTMVKPQSSLAYVLDDPLGIHALRIEAPDGNFIDYPLYTIDSPMSITYANFIYIAFKETFDLAFINDHNDDFELQQLVLGVKDGRVIIMRKCAGDRSQLWLMNSFGQLEHEGSSPPFEQYPKYENLTPRLVLDLEKPANPTEFTRLVIRPQNSQKKTTQTWRFENGRLMCHSNMCVQANYGVNGLRPGCEAVLGRIDSIQKGNDNIVPIEQSIEIQKLRPGSGHLQIINKMDGPIQTIQIHDIKNPRIINLTPDPMWNHRSIYNKNIIDTKTSNSINEFFMQLTLMKGVGISIITGFPFEELMYITLENINIVSNLMQYSKSLDLDVGTIQIDNQLLDTTCSVLFYMSKCRDNIPSNALKLYVKLFPSPNEYAVIFEEISFNLRPCVVNLEERLILKAAYFFNNTSKLNQKNVHTTSIVYQVDDYVFSKNTKRYYLENFYIGSTQIRLSVLTASKLSSELLEMKRSLGLTLIKFEDALIVFDKFVQHHNFETLSVYFKCLKAHYINQLKWHAASILGSVDFLGSPLGFANDLSEGVSGLIFEGSVKSLVRNVTHGISNSTAKLTEALSDSLGRVVLDDQDNETRQKILEVDNSTTGNYLSAGLKCFGFGLLGGVTSIVRQTYMGTQSDGFPGFLSGLGKGLLGTVTKPIIGVLDLASETASAVRETSRGLHHSLPVRKRLPRCVTGAPGDLLPAYSYRQSKGQQYLYMINRRNFDEKLIFYEPNLCNDKEAKLRLLVSTEYVRIFSLYQEVPDITFECHLNEILSCHSVVTNKSTNVNKLTIHYYIEISTNLPKVTRPRIRCQNEEVAENAARCITYAKASFNERELLMAYF